MSYYSYHARIRARIADGEMIGAEYVDNYPRIGRALVLYFNTVPAMRPIRPHAWGMYEDVIGGTRIEGIISLGGSNAGRAAQDDYGD